MLKIIFLLLIIIFPFIDNAQSIVGKGKAVDPYHFTIQKNQTFSKGAVASAHPIAS